MDPAGSVDRVDGAAPAARADSVGREGRVVVSVDPEVRAADSADPVVLGAEVPADLVVDLEHRAADQEVKAEHHWEHSLPSSL